MNREFFRIFLGGALVGSLIFFVPFMLVKVFLFIMFFKLIFHLFQGKRHKSYMWAQADKIRGMNDEEYAKYKSNYGKHCGRHCR